MNILHLSTGDRYGGAAIAAYRLNEAMNSIGLNSKMLVLNNLSNNPKVRTVYQYRNRFFKFVIGTKKIFVDKLRRSLLKPSLTFSCGLSHVCRIIDNDLIREADILYIHWAQATYINMFDIKCLAERGKKVYLFLHDMWYLTGGCNVPLNCNKWMDDCSDCPFISNPYLKNTTKYLLKKKKSCFQNDNIKIIAPSNEMINNVSQSYVLNRKDSFLVPNTLNTETFQVIDRNIARALLGLPKNKKLLLYGAVAGSSNPYKGWNYIDMLMKNMGTDVELVAFGSNNEADGYNYKIHSLGKITDETTLALIYNAVDVYVSPTLAESFGQTLVESISCGTKVVAYRIGGTTDIINHLNNGYLSDYMDVKDLEIGVSWALSTNDTIEERQKMHYDIEKKYSYNVVANLHKKYIDT